MPLWGQNKIFHVPFQETKNLIVVKAKINGRVGNFVFDTGAKSLVLNRSMVDISHQTGNQTPTVWGVNGSALQVTNVKVKAFNFGGIFKRNITALLVSLNKMERVLGIPVIGLIGYDLFSEYDIYIDYDQEMLSFIPPTKFMQFWNRNIVNKSFHYLAFDMSMHLPVVHALAGNKKIKLGIDTGAAQTLIDQKVANQIDYEISDKSKRNIVGVENMSDIIEVGKIRTIRIGNHTYNNIEIFIKNIDHINNVLNRDINGLIGYDILRRQKTLISYSNGKFVFVE